MRRGRTNKTKAPAKPRKTRPPILDNTPIREINKIKPHEDFIYMVSVYKLFPGSYNLEDEKLIKGTKALDDGSSYKRYRGFTLKTERKMVAAPLTWLKDKGYEVKQ